MNVGKAWLVFRKDWIEIIQSKQILLPIILVPIIMVVILPLAVIQAPVMLNSGLLQGTGQLYSSFALPQQFSQLTAGMTVKQSFVYSMATVFFAPFILLVPLIVSSIISSDSFAGEKERKTIEALLASPISDMELLVGKILVAFVPAMAATLISFSVYTVITDLIDWPLFGYAILPNLLWIFILAGLAPGFALGATGLAVIVSSRVSGSREAQQLSGLLIIPVVILVLGQTSGALVLGIAPLAAMFAGIVLFDFVLLKLGTRIFNRERMLSRM